MPFDEAWLLVDDQIPSPALRGRFQAVVADVEAGREPAGRWGSCQ